jgi:hypothetical protein
MIKGFRTQQRALQASKRVSTEPRVYQLVDGSFAGLGEVLIDASGRVSQTIVGQRGRVVCLGDYRRSLIES